MAREGRRGDPSRLDRLRPNRRRASETTSDHLEMLLANASSADREILQRALPYSMTGAARMLALVDAVRYCVSRNLSGALAECGVWRGGSALAMILTLQDLGVEDRDIYLYDTFDGMSEPTEHDVSQQQGSALGAWQEAKLKGRRVWEEVFGANVFNEDQVKELLLATGYPAGRLQFVRGRVEETIPAQIAEEFSLLRLDTDWYESTRHELIHMFPRLCQAGVLIIDDYGHWQGSQTAADEYFAHEHPPLLLFRMDYTGRMGVKA